MTTHAHACPSIPRNVCRAPCLAPAEVWTPCAQSVCGLRARAPAGSGTSGRAGERGEPWASGGGRVTENSGCTRLPLRCPREPLAAFGGCRGRGPDLAPRDAHGSAAAERPCRAKVRPRSEKARRAGRALRGRRGPDLDLPQYKYKHKY